ncbi:MAG TPA: GNAT family N-acetyltransferase [candidate division Zixibacteria bacterium]|nr:GNAT family N-acetyltransferase [candidate division Zixibacteria bacterium]
MENRIRQLTPDDYDDIIRVWADAGLPYRPDGRDSREHINSEMERSDTAFYGLFEDDRMVAVGVMTYDGRKGWINRVAVDPDCRGRGLAVEIVEAGERFLRGLGAQVIACLIEGQNLPSMALFGKMGYSYHEDILYFSKRDSSNV